MYLFLMTASILQNWIISVINYLQITDVQFVSFSYASPSSDNNWHSDFKFDHSAKTTDFSANLKWADAAYFKTFGLTFIAGHAYNNCDTVREFVVNETLLKKLGIRNPQDAIGRQINFWDGVKVANIVGVVRDFNVNSLHMPLAPVVMSTWKSVYQTINIKIKPGSEKAVLPFIEKLWTTLIRILFMNIISWMKPLKIFTNRKISFPSYIKFLPELPYSSVVLDYMDLFHSWLFNEPKK